MPLLESTAVAFVSTIGPNGERQTTPLWFLWLDGSLRFSLVGPTEHDLRQPG
jgi:hypothetical protein